MRWQRAFVGLMAMATLAGCKHAVELYCDEDTPCLPRYPDKPYCDLTGQYPESEGVGRTCIGFPDDPSKDFCIEDGDCPADKPICGPNMECRACESNQDCIDLGEIAGLTYCAPAGTCLACEPDAFFRCDTNTDGDPVMVACNADGSGEAEVLCGASCDADGERCIDCAPSSEACVGGPGPTDWEYVTCDANGNETSRTACYVGCEQDGGEPEGCLDIDPLNQLATYLDMAATADPLVLTGDSSFNTTTGEVINGANNAPVAVPSFVQALTGAPEIRVFVVGSLDVFNATVVGLRSIAIVSHGDVVIRGHFSASADGVLPGPGARVASSGDNCTGVSGSVNAAGNSGSGGGSFASSGGRGGHIVDTNGDPVVGGGAAGQVPAGGVTSLEPLFSGCAGGDNSFSGGGGGAMQVVSRTRIFLNGGTLSANGGGGADSGAGIDATTRSPGGGSGGGILLEAPSIEASSGSAFANGGGGGCIDTNTIIPGSNGLLSASSAAGGTCPGDSASGGSGASASSQVGTPGGNAQQGSGARAAGGGGGLGFIEINVVASDGTIPGLVSSPAPSIGPARTRPQP